MTDSLKVDFGSSSSVDLTLPFDSESHQLLQTELDSLLSTWMDEKYGKGTTEHPTYGTTLKSEWSKLKQAAKDYDATDPRTSVPSFQDRSAVAWWNLVHSIRTDNYDHRNGDRFPPADGVYLVRHMDEAFKGVSKAWYDGESTCIKPEMTGIDLLRETYTNLKTFVEQDRASFAVTAPKSKGWWLGKCTKEDSTRTSGSQSNNGATSWSRVWRKVRKGATKATNTTSPTIPTLPPSSTPDSTIPSAATPSVPTMSNGQFAAILVGSILVAYTGKSVVDYAWGR